MYQRFSYKRVASLRVRHRPKENSISKVTGAESLEGTKLGQRPFSNRRALDETPARSAPVGNINRVAPRESNMDTPTLLIIILIVLILFGGGWYGRGRWF